MPMLNGENSILFRKYKKIIKSMKKNEKIMKKI